MKTHRLLVFSFLLLVSSAAWPQRYHGYEFNTGTDSTKWIAFDSAIPAIQMGRWESGEIRLGFDFWFMGQTTDRVRVHKCGVLMLTGRSYNFMFARMPMVDSLFNMPLMMPYSTQAYWDPDSSWVKCQIVGIPGNRTVVFEFKMKKNDNSSSFLHWQVQLKENTHQFLFVYAPIAETSHGPLGQVGWLNGSSAYVLVNTLSHTAEADGSTTASSLFWPGSWRWYSAIPRVFPCTGIDYVNVTTERYSAHATWQYYSGHRRYIVEHGPMGFTRGTGTRVQTANPWLDIRNLQPGTYYEIYVRPVCDDTTGLETSTLFLTSCSNLSFANFYDPNITCRTGTWQNPSSAIQIVDNGSPSGYSRHTVHHDTSERDPRTGMLLRTIPHGHCMSVRLGNWMAGAEEEDISHTLQIDTNEHDILILRYAIVEEQPGHQEPDQPHFTLSIKDTAGNLLDRCSFANFVSGDRSGWIPSASHPQVLWHDWSAMGLDLAPYHGQRIVVQLTNYDCRHGAHYGYAYYTLEWGSRHLVATNCGPIVENTFRAPVGFNYRWYSDSDTALTLSTADTLHVTTPGGYGCHVSYRLMENDCGFDLHTRAGPRFPLARFETTSLDSCGSLRRFTSRSVVTTDAAHTQLTDEPCEQFLWRFDDGTTDTLDRVTHQFSEGTHTVTLVAMLGGGTCRDSVSQTFTVGIPYDTISATICPGTLVPVGNILVGDTGTFVHSDTCTEYVVHISWHQTYTDYLYDTVCDGEELEVGDNHYNTTGLYELSSYPDRNGCDSVLYLHLTVMDRSQDSVIFDTLCIGSELHYNGTIYTTSGEYVIDTLRWVHGCPVEHVLDLTVLPTYSDTVADTAVCGTLFPFADTLLMAPGVHTVNPRTVFGCDSLIMLRLSCADTLDTTICQTLLPFNWGGTVFDSAGSSTVNHLSHDGTDSIIHQIVRVRNQALPQVEEYLTCRPESHYVITLTGSYRYSWRFNPTCPNAEDSVADSLLQIRVAPRVPTMLLLRADWPDEPSCPWTDTIDLLSSALFHLGLSVTPEFLTSDDLLLHATETGKGVDERHWYVDNELQQETGRVLEYEVLPTADSVLVTLMGSGGECADTLSRVIYVKKHSLWFPNVFTPDEATNTLFRAYGTGIVDFELWIYDRRGALMFHTTDINQGWDGTSGGKRCRQESYAYTCHYTTDHSGWNTHTGTVTLLR